MFTRKYDPDQNLFYQYVDSNHKNLGYELVCIKNLLYTILFSSKKINKYCLTWVSLNQYPKNIDMVSLLQQNRMPFYSQILY